MVTLTTESSLLSLTTISSGLSNFNKSWHSGFNKSVAQNQPKVAQLGYREVATHYGCAYKNDGYRVMEEMSERVPGVTYKETRTLSIDDDMGVGGHHIEITFAHPDLAGWMRAHEANTEIANGGR
jgi:hypothetical protein